MNFERPEQIRFGIFLRKLPLINVQNSSDEECYRPTFKVQNNPVKHFLFKIQIVPKRFRRLNHYPMISATQN